MVKRTTKKKVKEHHIHINPPPGTPHPPLPTFHSSLQPNAFAFTHSAVAMAETDVEDDWPAAALAHDALVARVLLTLSATPAGRAAELRWGVTQRRSRPGQAEAPEAKKEGAAAAVGGGRQGSPTTPLSWSDGTSPSGGNGCVDIAEADATRRLKRKHKVPSFLPYTPILDLCIFLSILPFCDRFCHTFLPLLLLLLLMNLCVCEDVRKS